MKQLILIAAAVAAMRCFGIAASQAWVENYVSNYVAAAAASVQAGTTAVQTNGCTVITANPGAEGEMRLVVQDATDAALEATNCMGSATAQGITNGCTFVWNGAGLYINPHGAIMATPTNLVFSGVSAVSTNGLERFAGWFDAYGVLIQADTSFAITNGMTEVYQ